MLGLIQADKLASLGLLSAGVAHEINNPLAYVTNNLAVIQRDVSSLAEALGVYEEALPTLDSSHPALGERIARLTAEHDLPYIRANLEVILQSTRHGLKRVSDIVQNLRGFRAVRLDQAAIDRLDLNEAIASTLELIRGRLEQHQIEVVQKLGEIPEIVSGVPSPDQRSGLEPSAPGAGGDRSQEIRRVAGIEIVYSVKRGGGGPGDQGRYQRWSWRRSTHGSSTRSSRPNPSARELDWA